MSSLIEENFYPFTEEILGYPVNSLSLLPIKSSEATLACLGKILLFFECAFLLFILINNYFLSYGLPHREKMGNH